MFSLDKKQLRENILSIRNSLTKVERNIAETLIKERFKKLIAPLVKDNIAIYYPIGSELNILKIVKDLPFKLLLPVINHSSKILKFYPWQLDEELVTSNHARNIFEPKQQKKEIIPNIVIAPLIACDLKGHRIGSGKAMYDNTIAHLRKINPNLIYIGICYDFQIIDKIPIEKHDQKLDIILSETQIPLQ